MKKVKFVLCFLFLFTICSFAADHSGTINSNQTWLLEDSPHHITGNVDVADGYILTIEPGCVVKFNGNYDLKVYGTLVANGTAMAQITFTSNQASPSPGDWDNIHYSNSDAGCILNYCNISYGGSDDGMIFIRGVEDNLTISNCNFTYSATTGIKVDDYYVSFSEPEISNCTLTNNNSTGIACSDPDSKPVISDCTIQDNGNYALSVYADNIKDITGSMVISGNTNNVIYVYSENIGTGTWLNHNVPYIIGGDVNVNNSDTLTIVAGNMIKFESSRRLRVYGAIIADGTNTERITFTSNAATPAQGDWYNIYINSPESMCLLDYCDISYGGKSDGNIYIKGAGDKLTISNCNIEYSGDEGIYINDYYASASRPVITNCNISNNSNIGIYCYQNVSDPVISDCTIENNGNYAIRTFADNIKDITGSMVFSGNVKNSIWVGGDNITTATWSNFGIPYVIDGNITVVDNETLTITPGDTLSFNEDTRLTINGALIADGNSSEHIVFTSNLSTPSPGDWYFVYFDEPDSNCVFDYCDISYGGKSDGNINIKGAGDKLTISNCNIEYSGGEGIHINDYYASASRPVITNCNISNNSNIGIYCYQNVSDPVISDCTIENNGNYAIRTFADNIKDITGSMVFSGNVKNSIWVGSDDVTTATWPNFGIPYVIDGNITVVDNETLTITPGDTLSFNEDARLTINGALLADGNSGEHIVFTSNLSTPSPGDWYFVYFDKPDSNCLLDYCDISYGGKSSGNINIKGAGDKLTISNCNIEYSGDEGIHINDNYASASRPVISSCIIENNTSNGIYCYNGSSNPLISDCTIQNNGNYAIRTFADNIKDISGSMVFGGNGKNSIWVGGDNITTGTWIDFDIPYVLGGNSTVADGDTLIINEGNILKFGSNLILTVNGTLIADGSSSKHIEFTSNADSPAAGDWRYIQFYNSDDGCIMDYCDISYGGSSMANVYAFYTGSLSFTNCTISHSGEDGIYLNESTQPVISNCIITDNTNNGIYLDHNSSYPYISDCTIQNNGNYAIRTYTNSLKEITGTMIITGNGHDEILTYGANVYTGNWQNHGVPYILGGTFNIVDGETLTLEPGTVFKVEDNISVNVYGTLVANGNISEHITFTSNQDTPAPGDWRYLSFYDSDAGTILNYCDFSYGGYSQGNIYLSRTDSLTISNCTFTNSGESGIYLNEYTAPIISNCSITDNNNHGIYVDHNSGYPYISDCTIQNNGGYAIRTFTNSLREITGTMTINGNGYDEIFAYGANVYTGTWLNHNVPYIIGGSFSIQDNNTLTIAAGTTLKFDYAVSLNIYGKIIAEGTPASHITFTSNAVSPSPGDWRYLDFYDSDAESKLAYCDFSYGGYSQGIVKVNVSDSTSFSNCTFSHSGASGLYIDEATSPVIDSCSFNNNASYGIYVSHGNSYPAISNCTIQDNGSYAIYTYADNIKDITGDMNISGNAHNSIRARGDDVQTGTWLNHNVPYDFEGNVIVSDGSILTIAAGDTIRFNGSYDITVYGQISANGTDSEPIKFTRSPTYSGYWDYIYFYYPDDDCNLTYCDLTYGGHNYGSIYFRGAGTYVDLEHCTIKYGNASGLYIMDDSNPTIKNCIIKNNSSYGIYITGNCHPVFGSDATEWNDIYNNGLDDIPGYELRNGNLEIYPRYTYWGANDFGSISSLIIDQDDNSSLGLVTFTPWEEAPHGDQPANEHAGLISSSSSTEQLNWTLANGAIHYVTAPVTIDAGTSVYIEDGVEVRFTEGSYLKVEGTLNANAASGITFTRYGESVDWEGIRFEVGSSGIINNCTIEYVTYDDGYAVYTASSSPTVTNNTIRYSKYGFYADEILPSSFSGNEFTENETGVFVNTANAPSINAANTIDNNSYVGFHFYECTGTPSIYNQTITNHSSNLGAIYMENCHAFEIGSSNTITGNTYPLTINMASYANSSSNIPAAGNTNNAIQVFGGITASNFYWYDFGLPYIVTEDLTIDTADLLEIKAGATVQFENGKKMNISGTLNLNGTGGNEVYLTRNDSTDSWQGLDFNKGATGSINYTYIEYVTYSDGYAINADSTAISLDNSTLQYNNYGFYGNEQQTTLTNTVFQNNNYGYYVQNTANPNTNFGTGNVFSDNSICGIYYQDCANLGTIENLTLQNNTGYGALYVANSEDFSIGTNTIDGNSWPLCIDTGSFPAQASSIPITGNSNNDIRVTAGNCTKTGTWHKFVALDYIITETTTIEASGNLTIAEGDSLKFSGGSHLNIYGTFTASGDEIVFTRYGSGNWQGIWCLNGSTVNIDSCTIEYATYSEGYGIYVNQSSPNISNCTIQYNNRGIYINNGTPIITNNILSNNETGIEFRNTNSPNLNLANTVDNNTSSGIYFYNCSGSPNIENQQLTNNGTYGAIYVRNCGTFSLGSNTITNNLFPLTIDMGSYPDDLSLNNIPTTGNTNNDIQVYGGETGANSFTWKELNEPLDYIVTNTVSVSSGGTLNIQDGVEVLFDDGIILYVYGSLNCQGNAPVLTTTSRNSASDLGISSNVLQRSSRHKERDRSNGILFSRWETDESWSGIWIRESASADLDYCTVEYVTYGSGYGIYAYKTTSLAIDNCNLSNNTYGFYGNYIQSADLVSFSNNEFSDCNTGLYFQNSENISIDNSTSLTNNSTGIYFENCVSPTNNTNLVNQTNNGIIFSNCSNPVQNSDVDNCSNAIAFVNCSNIGTINNISVTNNTGSYGAFRISNSGNFILGSSNTITGNSWPLTIDCGSFPDSTSTIPTTSNSNNDIQVISGAGNKTGIWPFFSSLNYIVTGTPDLNDTLTVAAGNTVKFNHNIRFEIDGHLIVSGNSDNRVTFTRNEITDEWSGLRFRNNSRGTLSYCTIQYATYSSDYGIYASYADSLYLNNCILQNNYYGYYGSYCDTEFYQNQIINNEYGIYLYGDCNPTFGSSLTEWNDIYGNTTSDLRNGNIDISVEYVYWGTEVHSTIESNITDKNDNSSLGLVDFIPFTNAAHDTEIQGEVSAPENLTITISSGNVNLSWDTVSGATSYNVYSSEDPNASTENWTLEEDNLTNTSWSETVSGQKKFYRVRAVN